MESPPGNHLLAKHPTLQQTRWCGVCGLARVEAIWCAKGLGDRHHLGTAPKGSEGEKTMQCSIWQQNDMNWDEVVRDEMRLDNAKWDKARQKRLERVMHTDSFWEGETRLIVLLALYTYCWVSIGGNKDRIHSRNGGSDVQRKNSSYRHIISLVNASGLAVSRSGSVGCSDALIRSYLSRGNKVWP